MRVDATQAAATIEDMAQYLNFVDLTAEEVIKGLKKARDHGVRGGRVHDFIHALAAEKAGAKTLLTLDKNDFKDLVPNLAIEQI